MKKISILGIVFLLISFSYFVLLGINLYNAQQNQYCFISNPAGYQQHNLISPVNVMNVNCDTTQPYFYLLNSNILYSPLLILISMILLITGGVILYLNKK